MSILSKPCFHDEAAAFAHVESVLWPDGPVCPKCGSVDRAYKLKGVRTKPSKKHPEGVERHGLWKCRDCRSQFTVRIGTIFEESHTPLYKWLQALHLLCSSKKGISSHQLHRVLEVTYKTAWFLSHRIREAMRLDPFRPLGGPGGIVEADETFIGRLAGMPKRPTRGGSQSYKNTILTLVERGGSARSVHIESTTVGQIVPVVNASIDRESALMTDEAIHYRAVGQTFAEHGRVHHSIKEYVRDHVHTNTVEGYYSIFKRGMKGVYQHVSQQHLKRYLGEFDFRYNYRSAVGVSDSERTVKTLEGIKGKRLTYRNPHAEEIVGGSVSY